VLRGADNERVQSFGHQRLTTFGIGRDLTADQWRAVFRQLAARGLLDVDAEGYGSLLLTAAATPVLRGEEQLWLRRERRAPTAPKGSTKRERGAEIAPADSGLWDALRACRKRLAAELNVPPYVIFHDATLRAMLENRPTTANELRAISGVGDSKLERYGEAFLEVLRESQPAES
jgi:ATP-dependent DNA helicase RecQ